MRTLWLWRVLTLWRVDCRKRRGVNLESLVYLVCYSIVYLRVNEIKISFVNLESSKNHLLRWCLELAWNSAEKSQLLIEQLWFKFYIFQIFLLSFRLSSTFKFKWTLKVLRGREKCYLCAYLNLVYFQVLVIKKNIVAELEKKENIAKLKEK